MSDIIRQGAILFNAHEMLVAAGIDATTHVEINNNKCTRLHCIYYMPYNPELQCSNVFENVGEYASWVDDKVRPNKILYRSFNGVI